jgi:hypothetical protein
MQSLAVFQRLQTLEHIRGHQEPLVPFRQRVLCVPVPAFERRHNDVHTQVV